MIRLQIVLDLEAPSHGDMSRVLVDLNDILKQNDHVGSKIDISILSNQGIPADHGSDADQRKDLADPPGRTVPGRDAGEPVDQDQRHRSGDPEGSDRDPDPGKAVVHPEAGAEGVSTEIPESDRE